MLKSYEPLFSKPVLDQSTHTTIKQLCSLLGKTQKK